MKWNLEALLAPRVFLGAIGAAALLLLFTLGGWALSAPRPPASGEMVALQTVLPAPSRAPTPTETPSASAASGIRLAGYVQISGTQGQGLRVRQAPGLAGQFLFLAYDTEIFRIEDGPQQSDNYTWWKIVSEYDSNRSGWAADDYLTPIDSPAP